MDTMRSQDSSCPWKSEVTVGRRGFSGASNIMFLRGPGLQDVFSWRKFPELYTHAL